MENGALASLLNFVNDYGYWAVFILVFLQEIGVPNPVPNELILIFAGALTSIGNLNFWFTFWIVVAADSVGTTILFSVFYFFEHYIMERLKKWEGVNRKLNDLKAMLIRRGRFGIFVGRLLPYLRGYVSAAAGILNLPYRFFVPMVFLSAILWSGGYVTLGHFLGKNWKAVADFISGYQWILLIAIVSGIAIWVYSRSRKKSAANDELTK